ncbi:TIGR03013 family XrtA/PEP-CTERM system glycosyltransferase [Desulfatitalea alkaliphila]|uniref:TIGR03013 family PEP-CTERM/XrtA system glycosyltransferase n=1 Tax=Desulfatitalea alkaliphila TaxID=2929485 RepID=A0AA41UJM9_9BACT|nr:TIGR03013 family XrtA/PEP-CTERM system glycosyltransferase [Desulfatitalea alkaliphila]MCJ8502125.1 TIGR03013 family PEP-CTERM/XrtA system glycosyltransferase [Desulfatitalea alkaliphila]
MLRLFKQYYPVRNAIFVFGEGIFIFLSVVIACLLIIGSDQVHFDPPLLLKVLLITITCQACLYYNDLYDLQITDTLSELGIRLLQALGAAAILLALFYFLFPDFIIGEGIFIVSIAFVFLLIIAWRIGYTQILNKGLFNQKIMIMGSSDTAHEIANEIQQKKDCGYEIASVLSDKPWEVWPCSSNAGMICQNHFDNVCDLAKQMRVDKIVVALKEKRGTLPVKELLKCRVDGIDILEGNTFYEMLTGKLIVEQINPAWLIFSEGFQKTKAQKLIKRTVDLVLSAAMLIVLMPLILLVAIVIKLDSKGPAIFSQERVGRHHKPYMVHKFRSMRSDAEKETGPVWAQDNDNRITRVGHFIRKWRIDELPQLWNVIKGQMSFVGPRPEREHFVKQLEEIIPYYGERFSVKPGLTGWAQVSYGYGASVEDAIEKLNYDLFYIKNMSILMDIMIVARTVKTVLFGRGR